tara:strand:- start:790 stop:2130 length:1341 start_codon:yes stop_codon:yes gene_type:complete
MNFSQIYNKSPSFISIWQITWPIIIANLTLPIVTATDTAVMGREQSSTFIAAIALGGIVFNIIYFSLNFLRMSTTGLVSQEKGRKNEEEIKKIIRLTQSIAIAIGFLIICFSYPLIEIAKILISGSAQAEHLMSEYIFYRSFASPATLMNMVFLGVFIGMGAAKFAMFQLVSISILNAILSIVLVLYFNLGVFGVALGTVIAQWIGCLLSIFMLTKVINYDNINFETFFKFNFYSDKKFNSIFSISKDLFIRTLCIVFGEFILINNAAKLNTNSLAVIQIYIVLLGFVSYILDAFAHSAETMLGQSIGKKDKNTSLVIIFKTFIFSLLLAFILSILIFLIGFNIFEIFTSLDVILNECRKLFLYLLLLPIVSVWAFMLDGFFIGAAKSKPMRNSTLLAFCVFIILNYLVMLINPNIQYLWLSYLIFLLSRGVFLSFYFKSLFVYDN